MSNKSKKFKHVKYGEIEGILVSKAANQFSIRLSKSVKLNKDITLKAGEFMELKKSELIDFEESQLD